MVAGLSTVAVCLPFWPGLMSYDSLFAYRQSIEGVQTAVWPPMHNYLLFISRIVSAGPGGLFLIQIFCLFFGANLILSMLVESTVRLVISLIAFAALFWAFPTLIGSAIVIWKDVSVATFAILAIALWLLSVRHISYLLLATSLACIFAAVALRHNTLPLLVPFFVLLIISPFGAKSKARHRVAATMGLAVVLLGSYATTLWRLPVFARFRR